MYLARLVRDKDGKPEWHDIPDSDSASRIIERLRQEGWHSVAFYKDGMLWCKAVLGPDGEPIIFGLVQGGDIDNIGTQIPG